MPSRGSEDASGALPEPMQPGSPYSDWRIGLERITLFSDRRHADDAHRHSQRYAPEMAAVAGPGGSSAFLLEPPYSAAAAQQTPTIPQCLSLERSGRMPIEGDRAQPGDQDASTAQQDMVAAAPLPGKRKLGSAPAAEHAAKRPCAEESQLQNERHQGRVVELGDPCLAPRCLHGKRSPAARDPCARMQHDVSFQVDRRVHGEGFAGASEPSAGMQHHEIVLAESHMHGEHSPAGLEPSGGMQPHDSVQADRRVRMKQRELVPVEELASKYGTTGRSPQNSPQKSPLTGKLSYCLLIYAALHTEQGPNPLQSLWGKFGWKFCSGWLSCVRTDARCILRPAKYLAQ